MTAAELHREVARLIEENDWLKQTISAMEIELADARSRQAEHKEWFTPEEAARQINRSSSFLATDRMKENPEIPFTKEGYRTVRYHISDLEAFNNMRKLRKVA